MGDVVHAERMSPAPTCHNCGAPALLAFTTGDWNRGVTDLTFRYYECPRCGLVFLNPVPERLPDHYGDEYYGDPPQLDEFVGAAEHTEGYKVELVRRFVSAGRLIDVGPGRGGFAYIAKRAGFDVEVVEMDADCCAFISGPLGIRAIQTDDVARALDSEAPFDVITFWHVIEHLEEPWKVLATAARALVPGGILVLAAPNPESIQLRVLRGRWTHVDAPRHLSLIPRGVLQDRLREAGLTSVFVTTRDDGGLYWNSFGWEQSLANLAMGRRAKGVLRRLGRGISLLARPMERGADRGAAYTLVARADRGPT
jgi:SAM-dependent methyltransferase